jgi:threonine/homoserine/homoserine lactone efflux protein
VGQPVINWTAFVPAAVLVSLIPGASQMLGLSNAARYGTQRAVAGICGRLAAFVLLIGLVVAGLGSLVASSVATLTVIKWVGVGYLAWLGFAALRRAARAHEAMQAPLARDGVWALIRNEFVVGISNPKAMLLFAALLPQFASDEGPNTAAQLGTLGAAYLAVEFVVGLSYIGVGAAIGAIAITPRVHRWVDRGCGVCFLGLAGLLAVDEVGRP